MQISITSLQHLYQETINERGGVDVIFAEIYKDLCKRYLINQATFSRPDTPATFLRSTLSTPLDAIVEDEVLELKHSPRPMIDKEEKKLPIDWDDFVCSKLSGKDIQYALIAYYKDETHTVIRYLTKNNQWIDSKYKSDALFEAHKLRVVVLHLAIEKLNQTQGLSLLDQQNYFLQKLLFLARKNNQNEGKDDLQADKPNFDEKIFVKTCFSDYVSILESQLYENRPTLSQIITKGIRSIINFMRPGELNEPNPVKRTSDKSIHSVDDVKAFPGDEDELEMAQIKTWVTKQKPSNAVRHSVTSLPAYSMFRGRAIVVPTTTRAFQSIEWNR